MARDYFPGMGEAVAARTINRPGETWKDVAHRVALGNSLLDQTINDYPALSHHLLQASTLMSGRHLQHGDVQQPHRPMEVFTNCSTAMLRFLVFNLLLSGSGVGSCYDDDLMVIDLTKMPQVVCVIDPDHKDVVEGRITGFGSWVDFDSRGKEVEYFRVADSREGWAKAIEKIEVMTYLGKEDEVLVLDFSDVRPHGAPIRGMQNRPASGPGPLMEAIRSLSNLKGQDLEPWEAAMMADHYLAACVVVGGARRAARIAVKHWKDKSIFRFIDFKRPVRFLGKSRDEVIAMRSTGQYFESRFWSSNNSVAVDQEFYDCLNAYDQGDRGELAVHARKVWDKVMDCQYGDGTGEPGFLNVHKLNVNTAGMEQYLYKPYAGSSRYEPMAVSEEIMIELADRVIKHRYQNIVNPCVPGDTPILTRKGYVPIKLLVDREVEIWNGKEWSKVTPFSTGVNPLVKVVLDDGTELTCTPEHKFVVQDNYRSKPYKLPARLLEPGVKLAKFKMPVVEGTTHYNIDAYSQGFYFGDGNEGYPKNFVPMDATISYRVNWLAGLLDANGAVLRYDKAKAVQISSIDLGFLKKVRLMLTTLGVQAKVTRMQWECKPCYRLLINAEDLYHLVEDLGLTCERLDLSQEKPRRDARRFTRVVEVIDLGYSEETFCFTDPLNHTGTFNGIVTGQCGEITLSALGGFCVIADVVPFHAKDDDDAEDAFRATTRALIRTNLMESIYSNEVRRTNRIGVGLTGLHEYMWDRFGLTFRDAIAYGNIGPLKITEKARPFWEMLKRFGDAVDDEAEKYSKLLGVNVPHTNKTVKPAGTTSKLFGLTEGVHLPAMKKFLRWVQFREGDPLVEEYERKGYPVRRLKSYNGTVIVGFPTAPMITTLEGLDVITAPEATMEEQFRWLRLLEHYWLGDKYGNQISYTMKYRPSEISFEEYEDILRRHLPTIRAVSVLPIEENMSYEYLPEEPITEEEYDYYVANIERMSEEVDRVHVDCSSGACPIDFAERLQKIA